MVVFKSDSRECKLYSCTGLFGETQVMQDLCHVFLVWLPFGTIYVHKPVLLFSWHLSLRPRFSRSINHHRDCLHGHHLRHRDSGHGNSWEALFRGFRYTELSIFCHELRVELSLHDQQSKRTQAFRRIVQGLGCSAQSLGVRVHSKPTVLWTRHQIAPWCRQDEWVLTLRPPCGCV